MIPKVMVYYRKIIKSNWAYRKLLKQSLEETRCKLSTALSQKSHLGPTYYLQYRVVATCLQSLQKGKFCAEKTAKWLLGAGVAVRLLPVICSWNRMVPHAEFGLDVKADDPTQATKESK